MQIFEPTLSATLVYLTDTLNSPVPPPGLKFEPKNKKFRCYDTGPSQG